MEQLFRVKKDGRREVGKEERGGGLREWRRALYTRLISAHLNGLVSVCMAIVQANGIFVARRYARHDGVLGKTVYSQIAFS